MRASSCAGTVQEDGGGRCAGFLEAESLAFGELERGDEGAAEELEQHLGGKVLSDEPTVDACAQRQLVAATKPRPPTPTPQSRGQRPPARQGRPARPACTRRPRS